MIKVMIYFIMKTAILFILGFSCIHAGTEHEIKSKRGSIIVHLDTKGGNALIVFSY